MNVVTGAKYFLPEFITRFSFFSSPSMAKSKPPTASELYRQRRQREEEEKYAYLPLQSWQYVLHELRASRRAFLILTLL